VGRGTWDDRYARERGKREEGRGKREEGRGKRVKEPRDDRNACGGQVTLEEKKS
jgi:hypothetical protein